MTMYIISYFCDRKIRKVIDDMTFDGYILTDCYVIEEYSKFLLRSSYGDKVLYTDYFLVKCKCYNLNEVIYNCKML